MFKVIKENKIVGISEECPNSAFLSSDMEIVEDTEHSVSDYEQYDGEFILKQEVPIEEQNEQIRIQRQARFVAEADPLRYDYDEALARGDETSEEKKQAWLTKKDQIREELPYIDGE